MPCPFPGMDPYLEMPPFWNDFCPKLLTSISNLLLGQVLPKYDVRIEEYLLVSHEEIPLHRVQPDVAISTTGAEAEAGGVAVAAEEATSVDLEYPALEPHTQRRLTLTHRQTGDVVAVMELLSPANKTGGGRDRYLEKRNELLLGQCHLIELDLLRGGQRLPMEGRLPAGDYFVYVGRADSRPRCQVIAWPLRAALPKVPVPLLPEDPEATLDLAEAFRAAYEPALCHRRLPYGQPLAPALRGEDQTWVRERLAAANIGGR